MAVLVAAVLLALVGCGDSSKRSPADPDKVALDAANQRLMDDPEDAGALGNVIRVAFRGASHRIDTTTGNFTRSARPYLDRAAAIWPRYVDATGEEGPTGMVASVMVRVLGEGLNRPHAAAEAARYAAEANPSSAAFLQQTLWAARAGDTGSAKLAGQKALELAEPGDREQVRDAINQALSEAP